MPDQADDKGTEVVHTITVKVVSGREELLRDRMDRALGRLADEGMVADSEGSGWAFQAVQSGGALDSSKPALERRRG